MKKILIIITKGEIGGAQIFVRDLARGLKTRGFGVSLGCGEGDFLERESAKADITLFRFRHLRRTHNPFASLLFIFELKKFLDRNGFDAVQINSSNALAGALGAKLSRNKPQTVFTIHGLSLLDAGYRNHAFLKPFYRLYFKLLLRFVDMPVFVSRLNRDYALKQKIVKEGTVILNSLDLKSLDFLPAETARRELTVFANKSLPNANASRFSLLTSHFIIGSIGRLDYAKNYEFLIRVFPKILEQRPDAILLIIGEGPERKMYESLIAEKGLASKVVLTGGIEGAAAYLKAFDIFVLPSRYEGLSMTLIEALYADIPVLASRAGGNPEALAGSDAQLFDVDDETDFLAKLKAIADNDPLRQELTAHNLRQAQNFGLDRMVDAYAEILETNNADA